MPPTSRSPPASETSYSSSPTSRGSSKKESAPRLRRPGGSLGGGVNGRPRAASSRSSTSVFGRASLTAGTSRRSGPNFSSPSYRGPPTAQRARKALSVRLNRIRRLRNRVFHHEPVYLLPDLPRLHGENVETVGWSSPAAEGLLHLADWFPEGYGGGPETYRERFSELLKVIEDRDG